MASKNINWINAVKGICMIAVFYVHCELALHVDINFASAEIHSFYVNGFFFISGYLLFWKQLSSPKIDESLRTYSKGGGGTLFKNIMFRIIIPTVLFAMLFYLPGHIVKHESIGFVNFVYETIGGRTFWFTSALAVAELVLLALFFTRQKTIWFYATCLLVIIGLGFYFASISPESYSSDFWAWRRGLLSLVFLGLGGLYWKYEKWIDKYLLNWGSFIVLFLIMELFLYSLLDDRHELLVSMLTLTPKGIIPGIISVLLLIKICKLLPENKPLSFIGQNSIGFFFLCQGIPILIGVVLNKLFGEVTTLVFFISFIISVVLSYGIVYLLNRWTPWAFDLRRLKGDSSNKNC